MRRLVHVVGGEEKGEEKVLYESQLCINPVCEGFQKSMLIYLTN